MNLVLGDVVETVYVVDEDEEDGDVKVCARSHLSPHTVAPFC